MRKLLPVFALMVVVCQYCYCQSPVQTANDFVPPFLGNFGYGSNMGYYPPDYYDEQLAVLVHGSPDGKVPGVGVTCIRPALFDHFLDFWGYDIRLNTFRLYDSIGLKNNTVFMGFPAERNRDSTFYCPGAMSEFFKGMYEPIWDSLDGTAINEKNAYAYYIWRAVKTYKNYVKFWEIWNEPDLDLNAVAWKTPNEPGNWWTNEPQACDLEFHAPIFHYIRMLRISYEVIKRVDPNAYVAIGGIGYTSFLDAVCRYTDNPNAGAVSTKYAKKGGAYFDVLSYHSYPHIENSMREWSNDINNFRYFRHSDAGIVGVWKKKNDLYQVLKKYGYDGVLYPKKHWIITEINIPRKSFGEYIGSDEAQTNFMIKALVTAQMEDVKQIYIYNLADEKKESDATNEFSYMGLFKNLNDVKAYQGVKNQVAIGFKTTSDLLNGWAFDALQTQKLNIPAHINGAAFSDGNSHYLYVLWAKTEKDQSESVEAIYKFPELLGIHYCKQKNWNFSQSGTEYLVNAKGIRLTGSPVFLTETILTETTFPKKPRIDPNPVSNGFAVYSFWLFEENATTIEVFDAAGRKVQTLLDHEMLPDGAHQRPLDMRSLANGTYFIRLLSGDTKSSVGVVKM